MNLGAEDDDLINMQLRLEDSLEGSAVSKNQRSGNEMSEGAALTGAFLLSPNMRLVEQSQQVQKNAGEHIQENAEGPNEDAQAHFN